MQQGSVLFSRTASEEVIGTRKIAKKKYTHTSERQRGIKEKEEKEKGSEGAVKKKKKHFLIILHSSSLRI